ncbi:MAG: chemotaxis protein CheW [Pirellulales bacterium]
MSTTLHVDRDADVSELQFVTFYVGGILLGIDIRQVQEINRQLRVTEVPHAADCVKGVINLRGDVATVIDLRTILQLPASDETRDSRNLVVHFEDESIGFLVDRVSDILTVERHQINPPPTTVEGVEGRLISGVCALETELLVILDVDALLTSDNISP